MIVDHLDAVAFSFIGDFTRYGLRQKVRFNDIAAFTVSDETTLAGNDRSVQLKLALEANAVLMASPGSNDHLNLVFTQLLHGSGILFAYGFVRSQERAVQINRG